MMRSTTCRRAAVADAAKLACAACVSAALASLAVGAAACGSEPRVTPIQESPTPVAEPLVAPTVRLVSPYVWSAGETITALGTGFVPPDVGSTSLRFVGDFVADAGGKRAVDMTVTTQWHAAGKVTFVHEATVPPDGMGDSTGRFVGMVRATIDGVSGEQASGDDTAVAVEIGPSLAIWRVAPSSRNCVDDRIEATLGGQTVAIDVETIGLQPATTYSPVTVNAAWVDVAGEVRNHVYRLTGSTRQRALIEVGDLPDGTAQTAVQVDLTATDRDGTSVHRLVPIVVSQEYAVDYDGNIRIAELYPPVPVSSCLPGGQYGSDVTYASGTSESRSRSVAYSGGLSISLWVFSASFGINVSETLSSSESESLSMSGHVLPGQFGVFYRQTQRLERLGTIVRRDVCGASTQVGLARVTDWNWAPDLVITTNGRCPPIPPSNLPAAQVMP